MSDQVGADRRKARAGGRSRRRVGLRTSLAGLSVAGIAAAVLLTTAAAGVQGAAASESSVSAHGATTTTVTSSSSAGNLTLQVTYATGPRGRIRIESVTYSGGAKVKVARPALMLVFGPAGPGPVPFRHVRKKLRSPVLAVTIRLKVADAASFSGALPAKLIASLNSHGGLRSGPFGADSVSMSLVSGPLGHPKPRKQVTIRLVLQTGLLLSAA